jgi:hypothetical protein
MSVLSNNAKPSHWTDNTVLEVKFRKSAMSDLLGCRDMELLCRHRAALDTHSQLEMAW